MLRLLLSVLAVTLIPSSVLIGPVAAAPPGPPREYTAESFAQAWSALPLRVRTRVFQLHAWDPVGRAPMWLDFGGGLGPHEGFCGFRDDGTTSIRVGVRWATRRATERAIGRIGIGVDREGGVVVAGLTRAQILAVAVLPGVVWIRPDGCSVPLTETGLP